ncbi:MAG: hypothetical protein AB7K68_00750 [Bacteriovoracia bacterium]
MRGVFFLVALLPLCATAAPFYAYKTELVLPGTRLEYNGKEISAFQNRDGTPALNNGGQVAVNSANELLYIGSEFPLTTPVPIIGFSNSFLPSLSFDDNGTFYGITTPTVGIPTAPDGWGRGVYSFTNNGSSPSAQLYYETLVDAGAAGNNLRVQAIRGHSVSPSGSAQAFLVDLHPSDAGYRTTAIYFSSGNGLEFVDQGARPATIVGEPIVKDNGWLMYKRRTGNTDEIVVRNSANFLEAIPTNLGSIHFDNICLGGADINSKGSVVFSGTRMIGATRQQFLLLSRYSAGNRFVEELARTYAREDVDSLSSPFTGFGYLNPDFPCDLHDFSINDNDEVATSASAFNGPALYNFALGRDPIMLANPKAISENTEAFLSIAFYAGAFNNKGEAAFRLHSSNPNHSGYSAYYVKPYPGEYSVFQVVENPNLCSGQYTSFCNGQEVDLVAGKNADVVVSGINAAVDIAKSTMEWNGITLHPNPVITDESGSSTVTFEINPVPATSAFLGLNKTMHVVLRNSENGIISERKIIVRVRKTKPLHLGFVRTGFEKGPEPKVPDEFSYETSIFGGFPYLKQLYPAADTDFTRDFLIGKVWGTGDVLDIQNDRNILKALVDKENSTEFYNDTTITHLVGIVSNNYFHQKFPSPHELHDSVGLANFDEPAFHVQSGLIKSLAHELGHTFCIRFDSRTGCSPPSGEEGWHAPRIIDPLNPQARFEGYSNYDFSIPIEIGRGKRLAQIDVMMQGQSNEYSIDPAQPYIDPNPFWFSYNDYVQVFRRNIPGPQKVTMNFPGSQILISGNISQNVFNRFSTYVLYSNREVPSNSDGEYLVELKTISNELISSSRFAAKEDINLPGGSPELEFTVPVTANGVFVDIFRDNLNGKVKLGSVVIPADLIDEEVKYIPDRAFIVNAISGRAKLSAEISRLRAAVLARKISLAKQILSKQLAPLASSLLVDSFLADSYLDAGKHEIGKQIAGAFVRLSALEPPVLEDPSPFVVLDTDGGNIVGGRNRLRADFVKSPENPEYMFVYNVFYDGTRVEPKHHERYLEAESFRLVSGSHRWQVNVSLVPKRPWFALRSAIASWRQDIFDLRSRLRDENDPDRRLEIESQILILSRRIANARSQGAELEKEVGRSAEINFSVP